jgi:recombination protein RecT
MSNLTVQQQQNMKLIKSSLTQSSVQKRIEEMIGRKSDSFITSVLQVVASNGLLAQSTPESVIGAVYTACALNLPLNNNLGFAYIVPFKNKQGQQEAQFQLGYKGFIQLSQRTGQIKRIGAVAVYDGDEEEDVKQRLTSLIPKTPVGSIIGYSAYLETVTGFEAIHVMSIDELKSHAFKYSQTYKSSESKGQNWSTWHQQFDAMAKKTVIKLLISKYAPMSVELIKAIDNDQAIVSIDEVGNESTSYPDNEIKDITPQAEIVPPERFQEFLDAIESGNLTKEHALNENVYALTDELRS